MTPHFPVRRAILLLENAPPTPAGQRIVQDAIRELRAYLARIEPRALPPVRPAVAGWKT